MLGFARVPVSEHSARAKPCLHSRFFLERHLEKDQAWSIHGREKLRAVYGISGPNGGAVLGGRD